MLTVKGEVSRMIQALLVAAGENAQLERETTEIIPLAMAHAMTFERTTPQNINLCAQVSIIRALAGLAPIVSRETSC